jgi:hypothetical protein
LITDAIAGEPQLPIGRIYDPQLLQLEQIIVQNTPQALFISHQLFLPIFSSGTRPAVHTRQAKGQILIPHDENVANDENHRLKWD